jgi:enamine deaminase RidA (YjgF/YER057c/UK114 family)
MFGDAGRGARSAVGVSSLPKGWAVEVEAVFELKENLCK